MTLNDLIAMIGGVYVPKDDILDAQYLLEEAEKRLVSMRNALHAAADQFTQYEDGHLGKAEQARDMNSGPDYELECYRKAAANKVWAARCRSAAL